MMGNEIEDNVMPLFLINGFLEAGKTQFLEWSRTIFRQKEKLC